MSVLIVMPARLGAQRLPGKPLRLLGGVPLIVRVASRVMAFGVADRCVVATDSVDIQTVCHDAGIETVMTGDQHLSGTDRVAEVAARPEFARYEVIVNVQGDEPFVEADAIAGSVSMITSGRFSLGTSAAPADAAVVNRPDVVKVVCDAAQRALYFSRAPIPFLRDPVDTSERDVLVRQHIGVYAYTPDALRRWVSLPSHPLERVERLEQLRALANGMAIGVAEAATAGLGGIDTEHDLARAEAFFSQQFSHPSH
jgi:3-deoxy-manno-octulosonate cytidylyltransferase (CMP-KDO synthetase)